MSNPIPKLSETFDRTLEDRIVKRLSDQNPKALHALHVFADQGTVTLSGTVDSHAAKRAVLIMARQVPGVRRVVDDIEVPVLNAGDSWRASRYTFSPGLAHYFEQRRQELIFNSALAWNF
jgi:hypothetical protein